MAAGQSTGARPAACRSSTWRPESSSRSTRSQSTRQRGPHRALARARFIVVSAPRDGLPDTALGGVSVRAPGGAPRYVTEPSVVVERMAGESLSVCIHEPSRTAIATHPAGGMLTFWNLDTGALFGMLETPYARGVTLTLDQRYFVVSFGVAAQLLSSRRRRSAPCSTAPRGRALQRIALYAWAPPAA